MGGWVDGWVEGLEEKEGDSQEWGGGRRRKREDHIILVEMTRDDGDGEVFFL